MYKGKHPVWQHTFVSPSAFSRRAVVSYWRKYVHEVLVNRLGGLSLPRKSVVRLTDRPDMTLDVYRGRKTTTTTTKGSYLCYLLFTHSSTFLKRKRGGGEGAKIKLAELLHLKSLPFTWEFLLILYTSKCGSL